ncbi:hypothetical protein JCM10213v2_001646 [Rhodosporidiobolus nylandii]
MARGKSTPRRASPNDDDYYTPAATPSPSRRPPSTASPARSAYARAQENVPGAQPVQKKAERGPLSEDKETQYHQRLKALLTEHKKARRQWTELVIRGLVGRARAALELWTDVELVLKAIEKGSSSAGAVRAGYLFAQSAKLSEQIAAVEGVFDNLVEVSRAFSSIVERAEWLLTEVSKTRGIAWAFQQPLWVTWPLSRFADEPPAERPSNEQLQAAMSLLAVQPLLPGKLQSGSSEAWEEVLAAEVGGWA